MENRIRYGHKVFTYMSSIGFQFGVLIPSLLAVLILACYYGATIYAIKGPWSIHSTVSSK